MYVTLPWFIALVFFWALTASWNHLDHRWLIGHLDDNDDNADRRTKSLEDRIDRAEDWIRYLADDRNRPGIAPPADLVPYEPEPEWAPRERPEPVNIEVVHVPDEQANPATVPITIPDHGPETVPDLHQAAKIPPPETDLDAMYADAMAAIAAIGKVER